MRMVIGRWKNCVASEGDSLQNSILSAHQARAAQLGVRCLFVLELPAASVWFSTMLAAPMVLSWPLKGWLVNGLMSVGSLSTGLSMMNWAFSESSDCAVAGVGLE